jgi:hypothetical protein
MIQRTFIGATTIACALACVSATGPDRQAADRATAVALGEEFALHAGGTARIASDGLTVGFERIVEDSRCPADTTCVWAGDAVVRVEIRRSQSERATLDLHTQSNAPREGRFRQYRVRLVRVAPVRQSSSEIPPDQYVVTLVIFGN